MIHRTRRVDGAIGGALASARVKNRRATLGAWVLGALVCGCYGNEDTPFPPGLEPWEATNAAALPAATAAATFPETLSYVERTFTEPGTTTDAPSVHARAYIQMSPHDVWLALRDPQTARDPTSTDAWSVVAWATEPTYTYSLRTHTTVHSLITLEWDMDWRLGIVQGTNDAPIVAAARWQKVRGTTVLQVLEGSIVLRAVTGQPTVTEVDYQYHLKSSFSGYGAIESYLQVIYGRLRDRAHGRPLSPNDCAGCPAPPAGY